MEAMTQTKQNIEETRDAILAASRSMVDAAQVSNKQISDVTGKMRDGSEKLGVAIDKMMKIAGRQDFAETVRLTQSFVDSLERLAALDDRDVRAHLGQLGVQLDHPFGDTEHDPGLLAVTGTGVNLPTGRTTHQAEQRDP